MIERRTHPRHKTFIKGRIYFNNRLSSMDCIVREISEHGSRLEFSENVTLPDVFELFLPSKDEYFQAHVAWRKGNSIGIALMPETTLNPRAESGRTDHHLADRVTKLERDVALLLKRVDELER
jgi:hypothetical protein